jgi:hypothetical protein
MGAGWLGPHRVLGGTGRDHSESHAGAGRERPTVAERHGRRLVARRHAAEIDHDLLVPGLVRRFEVTQERAARPAVEVPSGDDLERC